MSDLPKTNLGKVSSSRLDASLNEALMEGQRSVLPLRQTGLRKAFPSPSTRDIPNSCRRSMRITSRKTASVTGRPGRSSTR